MPIYTTRHLVASVPLRLGGALVPMGEVLTGLSEVDANYLLSRGRAHWEAKEASAAPSPEPLPKPLSAAVAAAIDAAATPTPTALENAPEGPFARDSSEEAPTPAPRPRFTRSRRSTLVQDNSDGTDPANGK